MLGSLLSRRAVAVLATILVGSTARAEEPRAERLVDAITGGKTSVALRYRFESVSDDAFGRNASASTLRGALGFRTLSFGGVAAFVEFEDVADLGLDDRHNNLGAGGLANGVTGRPAISDPDGTEVNQFWLRATWIPRTAITAGRQEIVLGNERFVGPVGFRQNHQSFDSARVDVKPRDSVRLTYAYVQRVHTVTGADKPMGSHAFHGEVDVGKAGTAAAYGYLLDYSKSADAPLSSRTFGVQWRGSIALPGTWKLPYHVEWAEQADAGDNPADYDASYAFLEAGAQNARFNVRAGYERLEGDAATGRFSTPLATLHRWNGWADKFTTTPPDGLEDLYISFGFTHGALTALVAGHDFSAESTGADYGRELNARVEWRSSWKQVFGAEAALYGADGFARDTDKYWLFTSWGF